jgi:hypothetical protein
MMDIIITIVIVVLIMFFVLKLFHKITINVNRPKYKEIDPTTTGERLKKYIIKAGKLNPRTARMLLLSRTEWSEGGKIAKIVGCLPTKNCTRFVLRKGFLGKKVLMYCPTNLHSSLHNKEVIVYGVGIESAGGYYYPLPKTDMSNHQTFEIVSSQFEGDLRKMLTMDSLQMELEQTYKGIAGTGREEDFYDEAEDIIEYEKEGDYNGQ